MTRFVDQQSLTVDGKNITVKTRPGLDLAAVAALPGLIQQAKAVLQNADTVLQASPLSANAVAMARRYFLTGKSGPSSSELLLMRQIIGSTLVGLSGDVTLKVGKNVGRNDKDVHGSVAQSRTVKGYTTKSHESVVKDLEPTKHFWQKKKYAVMGAMRLCDTTLVDGTLGVVTLIHEATHKYAGTMDYCYFSNDGLKPTDKFTSKQKALVNADSYAFFVVNL